MVWGLVDNANEFKVAYQLFGPVGESAFQLLDWGSGNAPAFQKFDTDDGRRGDKCRPLKKQATLKIQITDSMV